MLVFVLMPSSLFLQSQYSRQMKTKLTLQRGNSQFFSHNFFGTVIGQLEIIDTSHHTWQVIVRIHIGAVKSLFNNGQRRRKGFEPAYWQSGTTRYKLKELSLFFATVRSHNFVQKFDAAGLLSEPVIGFARI